jgi:HEAT repeat protein
MSRRAVWLSLVVLICGCEREPAVPQLPPEPAEKVAVVSPVEEIGRSLLEGNPEEKQKALAAILELDEAVQKQHRKTLHQLLRRCLSGEDPAFRKEAALVFVKLQDGLGGLVRSLDLVPDEDEDVLGVALAKIEETLQADDTKQKLKAVDLLSEVGRPAVGLLLKSLEDPSADVRLGALDALWSIGSIEKEFSARISALLKDPDLRVRQAAAAALERLEEDREEEERPLPERRLPSLPRGD